MADDKKEDLPSWFQSIQLIALRNVRAGDAEYRYRYICRWYSETFSTRLEDVEELPYETVLTHYFERYFEAMDESEQLESVKEILETAEERRLRLLKDEADDNWYEDVLKNVGKKDRDAGLSPIEKHDIPTALREAGDKLAEATKKLANAIPEAPDEIGFDFSKIKDIAELDDWDIMGKPVPSDD